MSAQTDSRVDGNILIVLESGLESVCSEVVMLAPLPSGFLAAPEQSPIHVFTSNMRVERLWKESGRTTQLLKQKNRQQLDQFRKLLNPNHPERE